MATPQVTAGSTLARGVVRPFSIPSCTLTADDLRRFYDVLDNKAREAAEHQVTTLQRLPGQTTEQFEQVETNLRSSLSLVVRVQGINGEWTGSNTREALRDDSLPDSVAVVEYNSAFLFRTQFNVEPLNSFSVYLDFSRTGILDMTNLSSEPASNRSSSWISGMNTTWVNGTYEGLRTFFAERESSRGWLHSRHAYDLAVLVLGIPASFALVYRIDRVLRPILRVPDALFVALYVYLVLIALFGFRLLFNYAKWVFPKIEGPARREGGPKIHKAVLVLIGSTFVSVVVETFLRMLGLALP
jgi:hypothetical protein